MFKLGKCPCVTHAVQVDCADKVQISTFQLLEGLRKVREHQKRKKKECDSTCGMCSTAGYKDIHTSVKSFTEFVCCPKVVLCEMCETDAVPSATEDGDSEENVENDDPQHADRVMEELQQPQEHEQLPPQDSTPIVNKKRKINVISGGRAFKSQRLMKIDKEFDSKFHYHKKDCSYQKCQDCGVMRKLRLTCPNDNSDDFTVEVRVFQKLERPSATESKKGAKASSSKVKKPRFQEELVGVQMTGREILLQLRLAALVSLPHAWDAAWDLFMRRFLLRNFTSDTLIIMTDFSATYDCNPKYKLNSAIAAHAIQDVFVVSHSPTEHIMSNGAKRRNIQNDVWHGWGETTPGKLSNDNYYHSKCVQHIIKHYKEELKLPFKRIIILTDGCKEIGRAHV